jgi:hypothetical protein
MIKFKYTEKDTEYYKNWLSFYPKWSYQGFRLTLDAWGYFDPRPVIYTSVTSLLALTLPFISLYLLPISIFFLFKSWGDIYLKLPWNTGKTDESENPEWGVYFFSVNGEIPTHIWIRRGKKRSKCIYFPWALDWYRTSLMLNNGKFINDIKGSKKRLSFYEDKWKDPQVVFIETHPYKYILKNGKVQERLATIRVEEMEWRRYYTMFTPLFNRVRRSIDVKFSDEVGERTGSWKGGCVGCGYTMLPNETPLECLRRMEKERKF